MNTEDKLPYAEDAKVAQRTQKRQKKQKEDEERAFFFLPCLVSSATSAEPLRPLRTDVRLLSVV
jgi:hypothetical protein